MTRKEEIDKNAHEHFAHGWKGSLIDAYIEGAEWSDKTMLDNVCEYLKKLVYQEYPGGPLVRRIDDEELKNLRKAIEE